ncbi:MAG: VWA domain-containing protein, partial [Nitrospirota bacterium]|nr:VWA domain-containing protein [Nitrospirota bacterium]
TPNPWSGNKVNAFHFLRPEWLWGFLPLGGLLLMLAKHGATAQVWESVCDAHLLPHVLVGVSGAKSRKPLILLGLAWALALVALAGPVWSQLSQPVFRAESALVILLDVSRSMDAQDVTPSRLTRAKHKLRDILNRRQEGQTALVVFAGEAFVVSPLTDDARTIETFVQTLDTTLMPVQGSRPDLALKLGNELLEQAGVPRGDLLLVTDGEAEPATLNTIKQLSAKGRSISVLGVGTEDGAPIPEQGGFVKDNTGAIVVAKLHPASLKAAARAGGGRFALLSLDDQDLDVVLPTVDVEGISSTTVPTQRTTDLWKEEGPWVVLLLVAIALPAFRRGWVGVLLAVLLLPQVSQAFSLENVWERPDQQGMQALEQKDPKKAAGLFEQPDWKGIAHYRAGDYEQAEQAFSTIDSPDAHYNRGNALAKLGKYPEAIASYQAALTKQADHVDAQHNLDVLKKMLEDQQSPSPQEQEPSSSDSSSDDKQQKSDGGPSDQQSQEHPSEKNEKDDGSSQAASQQEGQEEEHSSGSTQDPEEKANQSEASESQKTSQENPPKSDDPDQSDVAQSSPGEEGKEADPQAQQASASQSEQAREDQKTEQALQQWLRRIPDDPGGLLRQKFLMEHRRRLEAGVAVDATGRPW